jgi:hypothetical protein
MTINGVGITKNYNNGVIIPLLRANEPTKMGDIFTEKIILNDIIKNRNINNKIKNNHLLGELVLSRTFFPEDVSFERYSKIDWFKKVINIRELNYSEKTLFATIDLYPKLLNNSNYSTVYRLIDKKVGKNKKTLIFSSIVTFDLIDESNTSEIITEKEIMGLLFRRVPHPFEIRYHIINKENKKIGFVSIGDGELLAYDLQNEKFNKLIYFENNIKLNQFIDKENPSAYFKNETKSLRNVAEHLTGKKDIKYIELSKPVLKAPYIWR